MTSEFKKTFLSKLNPTLLLTVVFLFPVGCTRPPAKPEPAPAPPSQIKVEMNPSGPILVTTSSAEFQVLPTGYIQAALIKRGQKLTLDAPGAGGSDSLVRDGKEMQFTLEFSQAKLQESAGKL